MASCVPCLKNGCAFSCGGRCACTREDSCCKKRCSRYGIFSTALIVGTLVGVVLGIILRHVPPYDQPKLHPMSLLYFEYPIKLLSRFSLMCGIPMVVFGLISSLASIDQKVGGKLGCRTMCYYVGTSIMAVILGFVMILSIRPGRSSGNLLPTVGNSTDDPNQKKNMLALMDMALNLLPDNLIGACLRLTSSQLVIKEVEVGNVTYQVESVKYMNNDKAINVLGLMTASICIGMALSTFGEKGRPLLEIFQLLFELFLKMVRTAMWTGPLAMCTFMMSMIINLEDPAKQFLALAYFTLTVMFGLMVHFFVVMPTLFFILVRRNPYRFMLNCFQALSTAFLTSSSSLTLPMTMDCLKNKLKMNPVIVKFICPIGAHVNMDGVALYECMAVVFIATLKGMAVGMEEVLKVGLTALILSIGAPATGGGGLAIFIILFNSIGIPVEDAFILMPFDWILNRLRTTTNVWGDCVGVAVMCKYFDHAFESKDANEIAMLDAGENKDDESVEKEKKDDKNVENEC